MRPILEENYEHIMANVVSKLERATNVGLNTDNLCR